MRAATWFARAFAFGAMRFAGTGTIRPFPAFVRTARQHLSQGDETGEMRVGQQRKVLAAAVGLLAFGLAACNEAAQTSGSAPPRGDDPIVFPKEPSRIAVDLDVDLAQLERALESEVPRQLWQINRPGSECISSSKIDIGIAKVKSPKIKCHIIGKVTRGGIRISGRGEQLFVRLPVNGTIMARDVAGIFKGETATGAAEVTLALRLDLRPDWRLGSSTKLDYRWTREPGIDFMGQRITFTSQADKELATVKRDVERIVARELARLPVKASAREGWREAHAVFELNERNPAVWGRLTPQQFRYGGYAVEGRNLVLRLGMDAMFETFIGMKPKPKKAGNLPDLAPRAKTEPKSVMHVPVLADYAVLEPVLAKALAKRSARPFVIQDYGSVTARFDKIKVYGTGKGRIAVGAQFDAKSDLAAIGAAKGQIWLTARPQNDPGSRKVRFVDVEVTGDTDLTGQSLLFALASAPGFQEVITDALEQNFENDFNKLKAKIDRALAARRDGGADYSIKIDSVETGTITAYGAGLYMPVDITGRIDARLRRIK